MCKPHLDELEETGAVRNIRPADGFVQPPSIVLCFCLPARVDGKVLLGKTGLALTEQLRSNEREEDRQTCWEPGPVRPAGGAVGVRPSWFTVEVYKLIRALRVPPRLTEVRLIYVSISGAPVRRYGSLPK